MFVLVIVEIVTLCLAECWQYRSDYRFEQSVNGWLKLHRAPLKWRDARLKCQLEGAFLASPVNEQLLVAMKNTMLVEQISDGMHTGIHATFSKGDYFSVEGVPLSKIPATWAPGEPNNLDDNEECVVLSPAGNMADVNCITVLPYLCYREKTKPILINECGSIDNDYQLSNVTGSCYKFHSLARTWERAYMTCTAEGGHLAIINSDAEAQVIKELFAEHPASTLTTKYKDVASIGYHDWGEHLTWTTIHGKFLKEAGYEKWLKGQPGNMGTKQSCGAVDRTGLLNDIFCYDLMSFICEKDPNNLIKDIE